MKVVDANVLLYAVNSDSEHHEDARLWLDRALSGRESVGFAWVVMLAFLRVSTHPSLFARPLSLDEATAQIAAWVSAPGATMIETKPTHLHVLTELLWQSGAAGNLVNDAHLAAIALQLGATMVSYDRDFARFDRLRCVSPTAALARG